MEPGNETREMGPVEVFYLFLTRKLTSQIVMGVVDGHVPGHQ